MRLFWVDGVNYTVDTGALVFSVGSIILNVSKLLVCLSLITTVDSLTAADTPAPASDFLKTGYSFLEKHCIECHGEKVKKSGLTLHQYKDDATIMKDRSLWKTAMTMILSGEMPPEKKPRPSIAEIDAFQKSISTVFANGDRDSKTSAGHVAMRRLNRTEYNNTVRDLMLIDFNPTDDFPADEVGHGFDNISDVQWISAVHMERYFAAAEAIMQRAIASEAPKPPYHWHEGKFLEPASQNVPKDKWRPINGDKPGEAIFTGPLHTPVKVFAGNEYKIEARLYAKADPGKKIKVAVLACGKDVPKPATDAEADTLFGLAVKNLRPFQILKTVEVNSFSEKNNEHIKFNLPTNITMDRLALAIVKPAAGEPIPHIFVEHLSTEGPLDTRPAFQRKYLDRPKDAKKDVFTRDFLTRFVSKAFRRPATPDEIERYVKTAAAAETRGASWELALQETIQAILSSPKFLFRPELDSRSTSTELQPLGDYELASRLSYFLWSSMPDDELFALAEKKQLNANLESQVRRMMKDPKSRALTESFAIQWLQLKRLANLNPDSKVFPNYNPRLKTAFMQETSLFIDAIFREDRSVLDLIDGKFTFLNEPLAQHYRIADTNGNPLYKKDIKNPGKPIKGFEFVRVDLTNNTERSGILTQASVLAVTSNPTRTSPVKRGKWVLDQLLGTPPPPAPADVPALEKTELKGTLRKRLEQHRLNPACANCHDRMDPLGLAFENYDALGVFRKTEGDKPIDPSGVLPNGQKFAGAAELKDILSKKKDLFSRCLTEKMMTYALGRGVEVYDNKSVEKIMSALAKDNFRVSTLVIEIVKSEPFRMRKAQ